jgi:GT2 family glycosyltransferase
VPGQSPVWIGLLDLDSDDEVAAVSGEPGPDHQGARVLVRVHHAPVGYVHVPVWPRETLASRARAAAEADMADPLREHAECELVPQDLMRQDTDSRSNWAKSISCPQGFPARGPGISLVVCTRDRSDQLRSCLTALQQVTYEPVEVLVVDNAPTGDETLDLVLEFARSDSRFRYTTEPRPGLSRARNHGLENAKFDIVAFTDDDITVDPGWPAALLAAFASDPHAVCVTGLVVPAALNTRAERYFDSRYAWGEAFQAARYDLDEHRHPSRLYPFTAGIFGTGANFAVKRQVVAELGGFDCLLGAGGPGRGGEDLDMFLRLVLAGGRICYAPSALVWHQHRSDTGALAEQIYSYGYGLGAYLAKHLLNRDFSVAFLMRGFTGKAIDTSSRMQSAAKSSKLSGEARQLVLRESTGVAAGALCYYRATRQSRRRHHEQP